MSDRIRMTDDEKELYALRDQVEGLEKVVKAYATVHKEWMDDAYKAEKKAEAAESRATTAERQVKELIEKGNHLYNALVHNHGEGWLMTDNWKRIVSKIESGEGGAANGS